ncbi:SpoIIE family protein phosphatase [Streptomyces sp. NPDC001843]|uniref:SpoIIE family protein phosphatase n=1 Tax=Streptomyces sp. NPDC001843 TaxID=3364617 RepID=UPI0036B17211
MLALQQAKACVDGLGALAHWRSAGRLRLVAVSGLAAPCFEAWADLGLDEPAAPARAVRSDAYVWTTGDGTFTEALGTAAVPLPGADGPIGALSVLKEGPGEPDLAQRSLLRALAVWAAERLETFPSTPPGTDTSAVGPTAGVSGGGPPGVATARDSSSDAVPGSPGFRDVLGSPLAAMHGMREGLLTVGDDWRITFANAEAEDLLGDGCTPLVGTSLWDGPADRLSRLEGQCRRMAAEGRPVTFLSHSSADQRLHQVRLVPASRDSGLAIHFVDVTGPLVDVSRSTAVDTGRTGAAERPVRMSEVTAAMAKAVTAADVVRVVEERVLPALGADGLLVQALDNDQLGLIGCVGYPQSFIDVVGTRLTPLAASPAVADVLRTGTPRFIESQAEYLRLYPKAKFLADASPKNAWVFAPLIASGRPIGSCVISFARPRSFSDEERNLILALSGLLAQSLERARLYDVEHARAQELQRGLLPRALPRLPAVRAAARYLPASKGEKVGGDWYDVIPLSAERVAMVIGDVMGHGITEAATMGRLRTAVRTLADLEMAPDELLYHLNELTSDLGEDCYITCLYAIFDPATRTCSFSLAGHPPPVVVHPDGTVRCPEPTADPPLGAAVPPFTIHELRLPEESILVFYTDGLVESATRDIDQGLVQLQQTLARAVARTSYFTAERGRQRHDVAERRLDRLCDLVVSAMLPDAEQTNDDTALLMAHTRSTAPEDIASWSLPEHPCAAGQAREYVRKQLAVWDLDDCVMTTELIVSELVGNVIRHGKGPIRLRLLRSASLVCEVYDGSLTTPRIRRATHTDEGGRGLQLVAALSRRWGARYLHDGKCIWTEQELPAPWRTGEL